RHMPGNAFWLLFAQPQESLLNNLPGAFHVSQNPGGISHQRALVLLQCFNDPSGFWRVAHAAFKTDNGWKTFFLDGLSRKSNIEHTGGSWIPSRAGWRHWRIVT